MVYFVGDRGLLEDGRFDGPVIGMKGEERSLGSLAGLKPSRYNVRVGEIAVGLGKSLRAKRRP